MAKWSKSQQQSSLGLVYKDSSTEQQFGCLGALYPHSSGENRFFLFYLIVSLPSNRPSLLQNTYIFISIYSPGKSVGKSYGRPWGSNDSQKTLTWFFNSRLKMSLCGWRCWRLPLLSVPSDSIPQSNNSECFSMFSNETTSGYSLREYDVWSIWQLCRFWKPLTCERFFLLRGLATVVLPNRQLPWNFQGKNYTTTKVWTILQPKETNNQRTITKYVGVLY